MAVTQREQPRMRAALYLRMSLDRTGEGAGVERQESACRALADARGWDVVHTFTDNSVSASKGVRPQWEALLLGARAGSFDVVVAWALDRLVRRSSDLERLVETGVRAATVQGDLDLTTVQGELVGAILASVARAEVRQKGERQRAANLQRAQAGDVGWTRRPFGYARDEGGDVVVVPDEAEALKAAATHVLGGGTVSAAARTLTAAGVPTTTGKAWSSTSLRRVLLNPRYAGRAVYKGEDHGEGAWPVLLTTQTQQQLEDVLRDPSRRVQAGTQIKHLLSGLALCGRCGSVLYGSPMVSRGHRWQVYKCRSCFLARRADLVDEVVEGVVLARLSQPDAAGLLAPDVDRDRLRVEAVDLRERRDALAGLLADGLLPAAKVREQAKTLGERLREVEQQLGDTAKGGPVAGLALAGDVHEAWAVLDVRARREVVSELMTATVLPAGKGVTWDPEQVRIDWRTP